ncbi:glutathione peroxidase [Candidatus Pelagibacter sp.]|nr:glutathione peroxidase [Candidatus Pelagibacter sp.]
MNKFSIYSFIILLFFIKNITMANDIKNFYDLKIDGINGEVINFKKYKNKVVLLVNTASHCGFTKQYSDLQRLWENYKSNGLVVLGIPSNSFNQEKNTNEAVKEFCEVNFDITFPLTKITKVKGNDAHEIFKWAENSFGKSAIPKWNFHKILINKNGIIVDTYGSITKPTSNKIINKIEEIL